MARIDPADRRYSLSVAICFRKGQSQPERPPAVCRIEIALLPGFEPSAAPDLANARLSATLSAREAVQSISLLMRARH